MIRARSGGRSPTPGLLVGLVLTLAAVAVYAHAIGRQIARLRLLQTDLVDRNRKDSLQLLRAQNDLNQLGLAMRDMLDESQTYPLTAWSGQFGRLRTDLQEALARESALAGDGDAADRDGLADSLSQFWDAVDRTFALAGGGRPDEARAQVQLSLQARQASLTTLVARRLVENNERDTETGVRVQAIYDQVQRQAYGVLAATLVVIAATGLYLIRANRRLFAELASVSDRRRELAQQLIATRESTLRHLSRELHDELGQILTAMGSMLGRAERRVAADDPLRADLREVGELAQHTLTSVRSLSQTLHPSILDELGLDSAVESYLATARKQFGLEIAFTRTGEPRPVDGTIGIHVYRILQEAVNNTARHAAAAQMWVRLRYGLDALRLEVEDHGRGLDGTSARRGLGLIAMRERADVVGGTLALSKPDSGSGTLVRLDVPLEEADVDGA